MSVDGIEVASSPNLRPIEGALPISFIEWQADSRIRLCREMKIGTSSDVRHMPSHLPVLATFNTDGSLNLATKGVGLIPRSDRIERFTSMFRSTMEKCSPERWQDSLSRRTDALLSLYSDAENFERGTLGGLEIFEGTTYSNLRRDPRGSLLFTGEAPDFRSYQIDGEVEFVEKGDTTYEFLLASRELFARDGFHIFQSKYPYGFVFRVLRVKDKRPFTRR